MPKALSDEQYMAINAAFRAFDEDGSMFYFYFYLFLSFEWFLLFVIYYLLI